MRRYPAPLRAVVAATATVLALALTGCGASDEQDTAPSAGSGSPTGEKTDDTGDHQGHHGDDHGKSDQGDGSGGDQGNQGGDGQSDDQGSDADGEAIEVEINADQVQQNGKRVQVEAGQQVQIEVDSDRAGEFHVHASPEQYLEFDQGRSMVRLTVDTPGIVDVEEHESGLVVLQLEVR